MSHGLDYRTALPVPASICPLWLETNIRKHNFRPEKVPALFLTAENANEADDDNLDLQNQVAELFPALGHSGQVVVHQFASIYYKRSLSKSMR